MGLHVSCTTHLGLRQSLPRQPGLLLCCQLPALLRLQQAHMQCNLPSDNKWVHCCWSSPLCSTAGTVQQRTSHLDGGNQLRDGVGSFVLFLVLHGGELGQLQPQPLELALCHCEPAPQAAALGFRQLQTGRRVSLQLLCRLQRFPGTVTQQS